MKSKKLFSAIAALVLAGVVITGALRTETVSAKAEDTAGRITVSGEGKISVAPDVAYVTVGVMTQEEQAKAAQDENSKSMSALLEAVKESGIDDKDIKTSNYSIYPTYANYQSNEISGYTVNNSITITIRDLDKVGEILELALEKGGNASNGVQFSILDSKKYYEDALKLAISDAKAKGEVMAKAIGKAIDLPAEITEVGGNYVQYARSESMYMMAMDSSVPIQSGELTISASIQAVYEYK